MQSENSEQLPIPNEEEKRFTKTAMTNILMLLNRGLFFGEVSDYVAESRKFLTQLIEKIDVKPLEVVKNDEAAPKE